MAQAKIQINNRIMATALSHYNWLMTVVTCNEEKGIGTEGSEIHNGELWTLRDYVAEVDYVYHNYWDEGCTDHDKKNEDYESWHYQTQKMRNFLRRYGERAMLVECVNPHCSKWDKMTVEQFHAGYGEYPVNEYGIEGDRIPCPPHYVETTVVEPIIDPMIEIDNIADNRAKVAYWFNHEMGTAKECADHLGISVSTVYKYKKESAC